MLKSFLMENMGLFIVHSQYHNCCTPSDTRNQVTTSPFTDMDSLLSNHEYVIKSIHYKEWDEITYPFLNFNGATVEVKEWKINFIAYFTGACDSLAMLGLKIIHVSKRGLL